MKKLAVIGCGVASIPIVKKAYEMGIKVYCFGLSCGIVDKNIDFEFVEIDVFDVDKICDFCLKESVDGVIASSEMTTEVTAIVAERLNLIGNKRINNVFVFKNKYLMREALKDSNIIFQPDYGYYYKNMKITYPVMVKAIDSCGKKGITLVKSSKELDLAIKLAYDATSKSNILVEEYIPGGKEYSVESISYHGEHYLVQITEKDSSGPPHFAELGHHQPANIDNFTRNNITKAIFEILSKTGISNGLSHTEIKILDNKIYFIEVGARAGGDRIGDTLVGLSTNYDYYKGAIDVALGQFIKPIIKNVGYSGIYFLCEQTKHLASLFDVAKHSDWMYEMRAAKKMIIKNTNDDGGSSGYLIYSSNHKVTLKDCNFQVEVINNYENVLNLLLDFSKKINRNMEYAKLVDGLKKFITCGNIVAIIDDGRIIAMANLYCNNFELMEAYLNNVEVLPEYRGNGLSNKIIEKAIEIVKKNGFKTVRLNVEKSNIIAVNLYKKYGFKFTKNMLEINNVKTYEMRLDVK